VSKISLKDVSEEKPHYIGHRCRLKKRFHESPEALPDYELLELLLFLAIPRGDTKPLAKNLLKEFKSVGGVLNASAQRMKALKGVGDQTIHMMHVINACVQRVLHEDLIKEESLTNLEKVKTYLKSVMAHREVEQFRILFLNAKGGLVSDEIMQKGTVDQAMVYPREIVKRALELSATAFIMSHNHPSGHAEPSKADIEVTTRVKKFSSEMGVRLVDHVIVGKYGCFSFREASLL